MARPETKENRKRTDPLEPRSGPGRTIPLWARIGLDITRIYAALVPRSLLLFWGWLVCPLVYVFSSSVREALLDNARHILGPGSTHAERRRLAIGTIRSFTRFTLELMTTRKKLPVDEKLFERMTGREHYEKALEAGQGIIGVTLHMGNYEVGSMMFSRIHQPLAVVYNRDPVAGFESLRSRRRQEHAVQEIPVDRSPLFGIEVFRVLRKEGVVLLAADVGFDSEEGRFYPFFDGEARFLTWPARLSLASGAPLLPCFIIWDAAEGAYRLEISEPIVPDRDAGIDGLMRQLVPVFEDVVRRHPDQWLIIHRVWKPEDGAE